MNSPARTSCEICGTPKPASASISAPPVQSSVRPGTSSTLPSVQSTNTTSTKPVVASSSYSNGNWACSVCTYENDTVNSKCTMCGTIRSPSIQTPQTRQATNNTTAVAPTQAPAVKPVQPPAVAKTMTQPTPSPEPAPQPSASAPQSVQSQSVNSSMPAGKGNVVGVSRTGQPADFTTSLPASIQHRPSATSTSTSSTATKDQPMRINTPKPIAPPVKSINVSAVDTSAIQQQKRDLQHKHEQERLDVLRKEVEQQKQADAERAAELQHRKQVRLQHESQLTSIDNTVTYILENNEPTKSTQIFNLLIKLLSNILRHPDNDKYRTIKTIAPTIQRLIIHPIGPSVLLTHVGFISQQRQHSAADRMQLSDYDDSTTHEVYVLPNNVSLTAVQDLLHKLQLLQSNVVTQIPSVFNQLLQEYDSNQLYYTAIELRNVFDNILSLPDEIDYRKIDVDSDTYQQLFQPYTQIQKLLHEFGFVKQSEHSPFLINSTNDLRMLDQGVVDLTNIIHSIRHNTTLYVTVQHIIKHNDRVTSNQSFQDYIRSFKHIINLIQQYPIESKYRKINLIKYFHKLGHKITGGVRIFSEFGFIVDKSDNTATLPENVSLDIIRLKMNEFDELIAPYINH